MPTKHKRISHGDKSCTQHNMMGCPKSCWVIGRTIVLKYDGKFSSARTYETPEAAQARLDYETTWTAKQVASYTDKGLPVPEQFGKWIKAIWDGTNHN